MSDLKNLLFIRSRRNSRLHENQDTIWFFLFGRGQPTTSSPLAEVNKQLVNDFQKGRQHSVLILMNVPSLMVKIEFFKSDVVILFVSQDDHILNLLEGVIKTKTYMKKGLNTMSDLKNIIVHKRRNIMFKNN